MVTEEGVGEGGPLGRKLGGVLYILNSPSLCKKLEEPAQESSFGGKQVGTGWSLLGCGFRLEAVDGEGAGMVGGGRFPAEKKVQLLDIWKGVLTCLLFPDHHSWRNSASRPTARSCSSTQTCTLSLAAATGWWDPMGRRGGAGV